MTSSIYDQPHPDELTEQLEDLIELAHTELDQLGCICVDTAFELHKWGINPEEITNGN